MSGESAAKKAAEVEAGNDSVVQKVRLGEQAALMLNAYNIIEGKANDAASSIRQKQYQNFCKFTGSAGGHIAITNQLYRNEGTKYLFSDVPGSVLSSLLPSVKLYKVFYPSENDNAGFSWRIPFDDVPVAYSGVTSPFVENTLSNLLSGKGRMNGVGIKSFHYKFVGTNPAEVNTNIEAELELYFQDVRDLVKRLEFEPTHPNFTTGTPDKQPKDKFSFAYSDLIVDNPRQERKDPKNLNSKLAYNDKYFRLKVVCGYALPNEEILNSLGTDKSKQIKNAIESATVVLYLTPYKHDITFEEHGAVSLKIQYNAAMTSILANIDILSITPEHDKLLELEKEFNELAFSENLEINEIKNCDINEEEKQKKIDNKQKEIETKLATQKKKLEVDKNYLYSSIFRTLLGLTGGVTGLATPNVYSVEVNQYAIGAKEDLGEDTVLENPNQRRLAELQKATNINNYKVIKRTDESLKAQKDSLGRIPDDETFLDRLQNVPDNISSIVSDKVSAEDASKVREKAVEAVKNKQPKNFQDGSAKGWYEVKFVFLGDLLDIILDQSVTIQNFSEKPRIILNDFQFEVPFYPIGELAKGLDNIENVNATDVKYFIMKANLADIPISLNMLQNLLLEKLVKTGRTKYPLLSFLNDLMTEIIAPSVAPSVFGRKTVLNKSIRTSMLPISIPFKQIGANIFIDSLTGKHFGQPFSGFIDEQKLKSLTIHDTTLANLESNIGNYLILYCSNQLPENIIKNTSTNEDDRYKEDLKNGIYHFFVGSDKGIIKKINFSKTDTQFYREARAANSAGDQNLGRLREVYDTNITMFGNNIYRPGDFIYIEPLFFIGQAALDLQNKIGLGGYYQIIDVDTRFNENIFETNLRAVLAGYVEDGRVKSTESSKAGGCV